MVVTKSVPVLEGLRPRLDADDDVALWQVALARVLADAEYLSRRNSKHLPIVALVGPCSHWARPHQRRWRADGGFAWPSGYSDGGWMSSARTPPQPDWTEAFHWKSDAWQALSRRPKRALELLVVLPARSARHAQAVIYTSWRQGPPPAPGEPYRQFYGFRRTDGEWSCTATSGLPNTDFYALVAEAGG
jgi:hypothetical protein